MPWKVFYTDEVIAFLTTEITSKRVYEQINQYRRHCLYSLTLAENTILFMMLLVRLLMFGVSRFLARLSRCITKKTNLIELWLYFTLNTSVIILMKDFDIEGC